jgi:hypothetical protein
MLFSVYYLMAQKQHTAEPSLFQVQIICHFPPYWEAQSLFRILNFLSFKCTTVVSDTPRTWFQNTIFLLHAMKACRERRNITLLHLILGARWTWAALAPGKFPITHRIREWVGLRAVLGILVMKRSDLPKNIFNVFPVLCCTTNLTQDMKAFTPYCVSMYYIATVYRYAVIYLAFWYPERSEDRAC